MKFGVIYIECINELSVDKIIDTLRLIIYLFIIYFFQTYELCSLLKSIC